MKVMVAEDTDQMRNVVVTMLRRLGYDDVLAVENGAQAWEMMQSENIDLLLTDWNMPVMGGLELLGRLRNHPAYAELPVIMFTARAEREDVVKALMAGTDTYLVKPFDQRQLQQKITAVLEGTSNRLIQRIIAGADNMDPRGTYPLVVLGESTVQPQQLRRRGNAEIVQYLGGVVAGLGTLAAEGSQIGYLLEDNTSDITRRMREFGKRVRLLLLSTDIPGGGVTLARLASINRPGHLSVCLATPPGARLGANARSALEDLGVIVVDRRLLDARSAHQLLSEQVHGKMKEEAVGRLPSPEQIRTRVEKDIGNLGSLPVLPQVYHQITALDKNPDSDIQDWARVIEMDPLSRAQVIRRARAPAYGFRGEITEADKAVILLGKNTVKELIVSGAVRQSLDGMGSEELKVDEYWIHSVGVALLARILSFPLDESQWNAEQRKDFEALQLSDDALELLRAHSLCEKLTLGDDRDAFVGGMMHDIGKVALYCSYPGLFTLVAQNMEADGWNTPMLAAENDVAGGANHTLVGRIVATSWQLGEELCEVIERHHAPGPEDRYAQLTALADFLALGIYPFPKPAAYPLFTLFQPDGGDTTRGREDTTSPTSELAAVAETTQPPEGAEGQQGAAVDPAVAALRFLPQGLLEKLGIKLDDLVAIGLALAPAVRKLAEGIRQSL